MEPSNESKPKMCSLSDALYANLWQLKHGIFYFKVNNESC